VQPNSIKAMAGTSRHGASHANRTLLKDCRTYVEDCEETKGVK